MTAIVNGAAALIPYDRCAIAIQDRGKLRLGAVSGMVEVDRKDPTVGRTEQLLQWVFLTGTDVTITQFDDGSLAAGTDRPETEEKFRAFFAESGMRGRFGSHRTGARQASHPELVHFLAGSGLDLLPLRVGQLDPHIVCHFFDFLLAVQ